jgi:hypoxanthine phosphoribosyltransferase
MIECGKILFDGVTIASRVSELAGRISRDYAGKELVLVCVLKGAVMFTTDLARGISVPVTMEFIQAASYGGATASSGKVVIKKDLDTDIAGRHVLLVDTIIDTGGTMNSLLRMLAARGPASLGVAVLLDKRCKRAIDVPIAYRGFEIQDLFVVGYGMDYGERYRNLPYVSVLGAVGKGAQDFLVKDQIDGKSLERVIKYAIARKSGEERDVSTDELKDFDGKNGRQAYIAYKGKVFDVSGSTFWKNGVHGGKHFAGSDLTEALKGAHHGEDVLARTRIVGRLVGKRSLGYRILAKLESLHPHSITVQFVIAYSIAASVLSLLYLLSGNISFETASYYMLIPAFLTAHLSGLSGLLSWKLA